MRPQLFLTVLHYSDKYNPNTFPSSHTAVLVSLASAILIMAAPRYKALLGFWANVIAIIMGSILYIGVFHRFSDVIASYLLITSFSIVTMLIIANFVGLEPVEIPWESKWFTTAKIIVGLAVIAVVIIAAVVFFGILNSQLRAPMVLVATVLAIIATGFSSYLLQASVLRKVTAGD
ncbi:MAG: hypothetical protein QM613_03500 [Micrococcaceae bacterium]